MPKTMTATELSLNTLLTKSGGLGGMTRSSSNNALFNEYVLEVEINQSSVSPPSSMNTILSGAVPITVPAAAVLGNTAPLAASKAGRAVEVLDSLLGLRFTVKAHSATTFGDLKERIQGAQGAAGMRILPLQYQQLMLRGDEPDDAAFVLQELGGGGGCRCSRGSRNSHPSSSPSSPSPPTATLRAT